MSKYDFGSHINIPSETARLVWAAEQREALKAKMDAVPKPKPATPACPDCSLLASAEKAFEDAPAGLHCYWTGNGNTLRCVTRVV